MSFITLRFRPFWFESLSFLSPGQGRCRVAHLESEFRLPKSGWHPRPPPIFVLITTATHASQRIRRRCLKSSEARVARLILIDWEWVRLDYSDPRGPHTWARTDRKQTVNSPQFASARAPLWNLIIRGPICNSAALALRELRTKFAYFN